MFGKLLNSHSCLSHRDTNLSFASAMAYSSTIVEDYSQSLNDLTFNSRPIIENLTNIAQENKDEAEGILEAVKGRIKKAIPEHKLFALYLLDSICKYVGNPYNILIEDEIFLLYTEVFTLVDDYSRNKMINLFETWKQTKLKNGSNLFNSFEMDKIAKFLANYKKTTPVTLQRIQEPRASNGDQQTLSREKLIKGIDALIPVLRRKRAEFPDDARLPEKLNALDALRNILSTQKLQLKEHQAIEAQLKSIKQQYNASPSPAPATITPGTIKSNAPLTNQQRSSPVAVVDPANELFNNLVNMGLIFADKPLKPGSELVYKLVFPRNKYTVNNDMSYQLIAQQYPQLSNTKLYEQKKFTELAKIQSAINESPQAFLKSYDPYSGKNIKLLSLLYGAKGQPCALCGKRFPTDAEGRRLQTLHLDWHFRLNRKLGGSANSSGASNAIIQSRNWYLNDYEWVDFRDSELLETSTDSKTATGQTGNAENEVDNTPQIISYVVVVGDLNNNCSICREHVNATFNDSVGDWCWMNCLQVPGSENPRKIVHVSCFNEANNKKRSGDQDSPVKSKRGKLY